MKLKTLEKLSKITILVPDTSKKQPCKESLIPKVHLDYNEVRQEAIKHIKHFREMSERDCLADNSDKIVCYPEDQCAVCEIRDWYSGAEREFMNFFNITEEDL